MTKYVFFICIFTFSQSFASTPAATNIKGILYKKNKSWFVYVKSNTGAIRKGSLKLILNKKINRKFLKEKAYVQIKGQIINCQEKHLCYQVSSLKLAIKEQLNNLRGAPKN